MVKTGNAQYETPWRNPVDAAGLSLSHAGEVSAAGGDCMEVLNTMFVLCM